MRIQRGTQRRNRRQQAAGDRALAEGIVRFLLQSGRAEKHCLAPAIAASAAPARLLQAEQPGMLALDRCATTESRQPLTSLQRHLFGFGTAPGMGIACDPPGAQPSDWQYRQQRTLVEPALVRMGQPERAPSSSGKVLNRPPPAALPPASSEPPAEGRQRAVGVENLSTRIADWRQRLIPRLLHSFSRSGKEAIRLDPRGKGHSQSEASLVFLQPAQQADPFAMPDPPARGWEWGWVPSQAGQAAVRFLAERVQRIQPYYAGNATRTVDGRPYRQHPFGPNPLPLPARESRPSQALQQRSAVLQAPVLLAVGRPAKARSARILGGSASPERALVGTRPIQIRQRGRRLHSITLQQTLGQAGPAQESDTGILPVKGTATGRSPLFRWELPQICGLWNLYLEKVSVAAKLAERMPAGRRALRPIIAPPMRTRAGLASALGWPTVGHEPERIEEHRPAPRPRTALQPGPERALRTLTEPGAALPSSMGLPSVQIRSDQPSRFLSLPALARLGLSENLVPALNLPGSNLHRSLSLFNWATAHRLFLNNAAGAAVTGPNSEDSPQLSPEAASGASLVQFLKPSPSPIRAGVSRPVPSLPAAPPSLRTPLALNSPQGLQESNATAAEGLRSLRRERVLTLPSPGYTFAQSRPPVTDGQPQAFQRIQTQKVVEVVKKEVQAYMSSGTVTLNFSRTDYQRITDQVQSILARRLKIHKERLGLN